MSTERGICEEKKHIFPVNVTKSFMKPRYLSPNPIT